MGQSGDLSRTADEMSYFSVGRHRIHKAWVMLLGCGFFSMATVAAVYSPVGLFYVAITKDLGFARSQISIWQQVQWLVAIPCMPIAVKLLVRFNARLVTSVSVIGCALAAFLMGTYTQAWQWAISGALFGSLGVLGTLQLANPIVVGNWFGKRTGAAMGIYGIMAGLGGIVLPPIFSTIISSVGWRSAYFVQAAIILALGLPYAAFICRLRPSDIGAMPYGGDVAGQVKAAGNEDELKSQRAKVPWRDIRSIPFVTLFLYAGISSLIGSGYDAHLAGHAVAEGFDAFFGSLLVSALYLGSATDKLVMGWLNDKIGVNRTVYIEYAMVAAGMAGLIFFRTRSMLLFSAFLFGVQDSLISVSLPLLVRKFFGVEKMAQVLGWASIGSAVFGSFGSRLVGLSYDLTGSFSPAFGMGIGLAGAGAFLITVANLYRRRQRKLGVILD